MLSTIFKIFGSLVLTFGANAIASSSCQEPCKQIGQVVVTPKGVCRITDAILKNLKDSIEADIKKDRGFVDACYESPPGCSNSQIAKMSLSDAWKKCPGPPPFDAQTGQISLSSDGLKPRSFKACSKNAHVQNIELDFSEDSTATANGCSKRIAIKKISVMSEVELIDKESKKDLVPNMRILMNAEKKDSPVAYMTYEGKVDPISGKLGNLVRVQKGTQIKIEPGSIRIENPRVQQFKSNDEYLKAVINPGIYLRAGPLLSGAKQSNGYDGPVVALNNQEWVRREIAFMRSRLKTTQGLKDSDIDRIFKEQNFNEKSLLASLNQLNEMKKKDVPVDTYMTTFNASNLRYLPSVQAAMSDGIIDAEAKFNMFSNRGAYTWFRTSQDFSNLVLQDNGANQILQDQIAKHLDSVETNINNTLVNLPDYIAKSSQVPMPSLEDLVRREQFREMLNKEKNSASPDSQKIQEYQKQIDALTKKTDDAFQKLNLNIVASKADQLPGGVKFDVFEKNPNCNPQVKTPAAAPQYGNKNFDISTELSVDGMNSYLKKMYDSGKLKFCSSALDPVNCSDGHIFKPLSAPTVSWNGKEYTLSIPTSQVDTHAPVVGNVRGYINAQLNVIPFNCNGYPCLKSTKINANSEVKDFQSFLIYLGDAGSSVETALAGASQSLSQRQGRDIPHVNLTSNPTSNTDTGALRMDWNVK